MKQDLLNIKQRVMLNKEFSIHTTAQTTEGEVINQVKSSAKIENRRGEVIWHNKVMR